MVEDNGMTEFVYKSTDFVYRTELTQDELATKGVWIMNLSDRLYKVN